MASEGNDGCPCINATSILGSLTDRSCTTADDNAGVRLTVDTVSCVPLSYGSLCQQHEVLFDPSCDISMAGQPDFPTFCFKSWCYVDKDSCTKNADYKVYRSGYFPIDTGVDLFYSYETCNSTAEEWLESFHKKVFGGLKITGIVPTYLEPMMFKRNAEGGIINTPGEEYYDDSVPFEGVYINFIKSIAAISNGDIKQFSLTYKSKAATKSYPESSFTAAIDDIQNGLVDMAVGPFWITGERLKMVSFTTPLIYDKTVLVIPKPDSKNSLSYQTSKVLEPFTAGLWGILILVIFVTSLLSVWFRTKTSATHRPNRTLSDLRRPRCSRKQIGIYARLSLDSFLQKGLFFFSAGVDQEKGASLPYNLLMFGFGFFILISVSAYVANLAAFLTRSVPDYVATMEEAVSKGLKICGHPALAEELATKWPDAKFVFSTTEDEFFGVLKDYQAKKCDVLAVGREDTVMNVELMNLFCKEKLVYTDSIVLKNPIAFPIRAELASGLSYWLLEGEKYHGVSLKKSQEEYTARNKIQTNCNVEMSSQSAEQNDLAQIMPANMIFPLLLWLMCSIMAAILQIIHMVQERRGKRGSALLGRVSKLNLFENMKSEEKLDTGFDPPLKSRPNVQTSEYMCKDPTRLETGEIWSSKVKFADELNEIGINEAIATEEEKEGDQPQGIFGIKWSSVGRVLTGGEDDPNSCDHDIGSLQGEEALNKRIRELMESNDVASFIDCFHEMKKLKNV